jgi:hypothetical protein
LPDSIHHYMKRESGRAHAGYPRCFSRSPFSWNHLGSCQQITTQRLD